MSNTKSILAETLAEIQEIKEGISKLGYDADEIKADPEAYENLDGCCKAQV